MDLCVSRLLAQPPETAQTQPETTKSDFERVFFKMRQAGFFQAADVLGEGGEEGLTMRCKTEETNEEATDTDASSTFWCLQSTRFMRALQEQEMHAHVRATHGAAAASVVRALMEGLHCETRAQEEGSASACSVERVAELVAEAGVSEGDVKRCLEQLTTGGVLQKSHLVPDNTMVCTDDDNVGICGGLQQGLAAAPARPYAIRCYWKIWLLKHSAV